MTVAGLSDESKSKLSEVPDPFNEVGRSCQLILPFFFKEAACIEDYEVRILYTVVNKNAPNEEKLEKLTRRVTRTEASEELLIPESPFVSPEPSTVVTRDVVHNDTIALKVCSGDGNIPYDITATIKAIGRTNEECIAQNTTSFGITGFLRTSPTNAPTGSPNVPPDAEDDSKTTEPNEKVSDNVIEPNDSDPDTDDLTVIKGGGEPIGPDGTTTVTLPSGAIVTINSDGDYTYDPNKQFESLVCSDDVFEETFTYTVSDGNNGTDQATVTVILRGTNDDPSCNKPPEAEDDSKTTAPNKKVSDNAIFPNDSDPDTDDLTVIKCGGEPIGPDGTTTVTLPSGAIVRINSDGDYTYDPNKQFESLVCSDDVFEETFTYTVSDGNNGTDQATVTVILRGTNDDPSCNKPPEAEDDSETTAPNKKVSDNAIFPNDSDPDTDDLTLTEVNGEPIDPSSGTLTISLPSGAIVTVNTDGDYTYNPNGQFVSLLDREFTETSNVEETFTYTLSDGNDGTDLATVTIVMRPGCSNNTAPWAEDDSKTTMPNKRVSDNAILPNDSDPESDDLSLKMVNGKPVTPGSTLTLTLPSGAIVSVTTNGDYTYDPNDQFDSLRSGDEGIDTFTYTITDGYGGTDLATVTILMPGMNDAPDAEDDSKTTMPNKRVSDNAILPNDSDPDSDDLTVSMVNGQPIDQSGTTTISLPSGAIVTINSDGDYTYDPNEQFDSLRSGDEGIDTFTYTITDGEGGTDLATVTILMPGMNNIPSSSPSDEPSDVPSAPPSDEPSDVPSDPPSDMPSDPPSDMPSNPPTCKEVCSDFEKPYKPGMHHEAGCTFIYFNTTDNTTEEKDCDEISQIEEYKELADPANLTVIFRYRIINDDDVDHAFNVSELLSTIYTNITDQSVLDWIDPKSDTEVIVSLKANTSKVFNFTTNVVIYGCDYCDGDEGSDDSAASVRCPSYIFNASFSYDPETSCNYIGPNSTNVTRRDGCNDMVERKFCPNPIPVEPSDPPSDMPSEPPSDEPSAMPSDPPSDMPSEPPSDMPSEPPSDEPSSMPSAPPSDVPSDPPSSMPSEPPSSMPSDPPSDMPSNSPTCEERCPDIGGGSCTYVTDDGDTGDCAEIPFDFKEYVGAFNLTMNVTYTIYNEDDVPYELNITFDLKNTPDPIPAPLGRKEPNDYATIYSAPRRKCQCDRHSAHCLLSLQGR